MAEKTHAPAFVNQTNNPESEPNKELSLAGDTRELTTYAMSLDETMHLDDTMTELLQGPIAIMAVKVKDLEKGNPIVEDIEAGAKPDMGERASWINGHIEQGFQLIYVLGEAWKLFENKTGLSDEVAKNIFTDSELKEMWMQNHPFEKRRQSLKDRLSESKGDLQ